MVETVTTTRQQVAELTLIAPVRIGYVPAGDLPPGRPIRYADRLRSILGVFQASEGPGLPPSIIRLFGGIHFAHWSLFDGDTRLLLSVSFDGDWDTYMRNLVIDTPGFLHLIFANCEGWSRLDDPEPDARFAKMSEFVARYQVGVSFFYAHYPDLTAHDVDWLRLLRDKVDAHVGEGLDRAGLQAVYADIATELAPAPLADRRKAALDKLDKGVVDRARDTYLAVAGAMYKPDEVADARKEAFG